MEEFVGWCRTEVSSGTCSFYEDKLKALVERFGDVPLADLTARDGVAYKEWLLREKEWTRGTTRKVGLGAITVNHHVRAAKRLLNWAKMSSRTYRLDNPFEELSLLPEKGRERLMTEEEFTALLEACTDGAIRGGAADCVELLTVLRYTTLRPGELRLLRWEYVEWPNHRIVFPLEVVKVRKRRVVTLVDRVEQVLSDRKERLARLGVASPYVFAGPAVVGGVMTAGASQEPVQANSLSQRFRRLTDRCVTRGTIQKTVRGERLVPYSNRHTSITRLVVAGAHPQVIQNEAGHASPTTTQRYVHLADEQVVQSVRQALEGVVPNKGDKGANTRQDSPDDSQ